jgi:glycosyl hydrolase family 47
MRKYLSALVLLALTSAAPPLVSAQIRISDDPGPLAKQVRSEFLYSWNAYKQYAWRHDELMPLSKSSHDWHSASLMMTPVDALDTMILMNLNEEADKARELIDKDLSFDQDSSVKVFEVTIRLLGGLLSSYQLTGDKRLLELAQDLGTRLLPAFNSPTGMPYMYVNLKTGKTKGSVSNPAEIGTLLLEFGTLSKLTGNPVFYDKAKRALTELYSRRSKLGLVGSTINVETGKWVDTTSHISGGIDSYYEYLLKSWLLFGDKDCEKMWKTSIEAVNKHLADSTRTGFWYSPVDMNTGKKINTHYGALDAFFPAVLVRSGDTERARKFEDSAYKVWTNFGIEPEEVDYMTMSVVSPGYALRPEIIESAYYLFYYTKDDKYQEMAATFLGSLIRNCKSESGYAALRDVSSHEKADIMQSYFLAETLKYLYLLYAPRDTVDLSKVVFNTEAHPLRKTWQ